jgi:hypothetical protein
MKLRASRAIVLLRDFDSQKMVKIRNTTYYSQLSLSLSLSLALSLSLSETLSQVFSAVLSSQPQHRWGLHLAPSFRSFGGRHRRCPRSCCCWCCVAQCAALSHKRRWQIFLFLHECRTIVRCSFSHVVSPLWCQVITGHVLLQLLQMLLMHACARGKRLLNCQRVRATVVSSLDCCMLAKVRAREWVVLDAISG